MVVGFGHRLGRPVLVDGADLELLEVAAIGVGAGRLALALVGGEVGVCHLGVSSGVWSGVRGAEACQRTRCVDSSVNAGASSGRCRPHGGMRATPPPPTPPIPT